MATQRGNRWYADWQDEHGSRRRKSFTKRAAAEIHEDEQRAYTAAIVALEKIKRAVPPKLRKIAAALVKGTQELRAA